MIMAHPSGLFLQVKQMYILENGCRLKTIAGLNGPNVKQSDFASNECLVGTNNLQLHQI